jgi:hypothetical protein
VRDHEARELDWPVHTDKVLMTLELPDSTGALGKAIGAKLRSQCRRALKEGARGAHGGAELIPEFYRVFAANMRDLGTPVYPRRWFEVLARHFGDAMRLVVVRCTTSRRRAACWCAGTIRWRFRGRPRRGSSTATRSTCCCIGRRSGYAIETAVARRFDFGRSTRDSGPHKLQAAVGREPSRRSTGGRPAGRGPAGGASAGPQGGLDEAAGPGGEPARAADSRTCRGDCARRELAGETQNPPSEYAEKIAKSHSRSAAALAGPHRWRRGPGLLVLTYHRVLPIGHHPIASPSSPACW